MKECQNCTKLIIKGNLCKECQEELREAREARKAEIPNRVYGNIIAPRKAVFTNERNVKFQ
jgi:hypothetical protein